MNGFKLPKYWYIKVTDENLVIIDKWKKTTEYPGSAKGWYCVNEQGGQRMRVAERISTEQFKKYVAKQDDMSEIIGYKLKDDCEGYRKAAQSICMAHPGCTGSRYLDYEDPIMYLIGGKNTHENTIIDSVKILKQAKVLDLWFEPVYAPKYTLPKINGYEGRIDGKYVVYGNNCAWLDVWALRGILATAETWQRAAIDTKENSHNRSIKSITLSSDVEITIDEIKQIVEYFDNL